MPSFFQLRRFPPVRIEPPPIACTKVEDSPQSLPHAAQIHVEHACLHLVNEACAHEDTLRGYLHNHFPTVEADDVVQESYLKLLKASLTANVASPKAYFFAIARNTALTLFHRQQIYSDVPVNQLPDWRVLSDGVGPAEMANERQKYDLVIAAIDLLPRKCRKIVVLVLVDGLSYSEISARLKVSETTVRVQVARGIGKIAQYLRTRGER